MRCECVQVGTSMRARIAIRLAFNAGKAIVLCIARCRCRAHLQSYFACAGACVHNSVEFEVQSFEY